MSNKVVHVSDSLHSAVKDFCQENKLPMKEFVDTVLRAAISGRAPMLEVKEPVLKKEKTLSGGQREGTDDPWQSKPFWQQKDIKDQKERSEGLEGYSEGAPG